MRGAEMVDFLDAGTVLALLGAGAASAWTVSSFSRNRAAAEVGRADDRASALREDLLNHKLELAQAQRLLELARNQHQPSSNQKELEILNDLRKALDDTAQSLWTSRAGAVPDAKLLLRSPSAPPVLVISNLKGGVGKTTFTVNLGAYFQHTLKKRVLFIDTDYQGSLTNNLLVAAGATANISSSSTWLRFDADPAAVLENAAKLDSVLPGCALLGSDYRLNEFEMKEQLRWLIKETELDVRFRLSRILASERVAELFDIVIIDAPPRLGTAGVNALAAADFFLIPTLLTQTSLEPIKQMLALFRGVFSSLNPRLRLLGVVANQTYHLKGFTKDEQPRIAPINEVLEAYQPGARFLSSIIKRQPTIAKLAGNRIAYLNDHDEDVQRSFDALGAEVWNLMEQARKLQSTYSTAG